MTLYFVPFSNDIKQVIETIPAVSQYLPNILLFDIVLEHLLNQVPWKVKSFVLVNCRQVYLILLKITVKVIYINSQTELP